MECQKTQKRTETKQIEDASGAPGGDPSGGLAAQASAWGDVARRARADCQKGVEAEQELLRRKNTSGQ